ncbi:MAG: MFS transporter [Mesorhizobium sp.]|nr:MAG: MFS transporter [Mesorhizobium sp.]
MAILERNQTRRDPAQGSPPAPAIAIASVVLSMALVAVGNGLMFAYIPVRLGAEGFDPTWAGLIVTGLSAGGLAGCILTGPLVRRVGHARAFMVLSALIVLSNAAVGAGPHPLSWIAARALYGFAICGLFIVAQSWLNDVIANAIRGRVMAFFYVAYVAGLGVGYSTLALIDIRAADAPLVGIAFTALSILPVGLTRLAQPPPRQAALVVIYVVWAGASESIYSLASAHAADRAGKDDMVALSSSLLFAWSLSGFIVPGIVTGLSAVYGTQAFIHVAIVIATVFCLFVLWRVVAMSPVPAAETGNFAPMSAQAPLPVDLAFPSEEQRRADK